MEKYYINSLAWFKTDASQLRPNREQRRREEPQYICPDNTEDVLKV